MSIAVDQTRLHRIVHDILGTTVLKHAEAEAILEIARLAAGVTPESAAEHAALQSVAQQISSMIGARLGEQGAIPSVADGEARAARVESLAARLRTRSARELAFAFAFLVSVADLELTPVETEALEEFQRALGLDDRCAMDLIISTSNTVAGGESSAATI